MAPSHPAVVAAQLNCRALEDEHAAAHAELAPMLASMRPRFSASVKKFNEDFPVLLEQLREERARSVPVIVSQLQSSAASAAKALSAQADACLLTSYQLDCAAQVLLALVEQGGEALALSESAMKLLQWAATADYMPEVCTYIDGSADLEAQEEAEGALYLRNDISSDTCACEWPVCVRVRVGVRWA